MAVVREPIFVWRVNLLGATPLSAMPMESLLDASERGRARQFRRADDRDAFVACRGALRILLGRFLARDPLSLRFQYGVHEKPSLEDAVCAFNVSRSAGLAVIAISAAGILGIDVERIRGDVDMAAVATEFLTSSERAALRRVPPTGRTQAFFRLWVRREARVKATGRGLVVPADESPRADEAHLILRELHVGDEYVAAVAADGARDRPVVQLDFDLVD